MLTPPSRGCQARWYRCDGSRRCHHGLRWSPLADAPVAPTSHQARTCCISAPALLSWLFNGGADDTSVRLLPGWTFSSFTSRTATRSSPFRRALTVGGLARGKRAAGGGGAARPSHSISSRRRIPARAQLPAHLAPLHLHDDRAAQPGACVQPRLIHSRALTHRAMCVAVFVWRCVCRTRPSLRPCLCRWRSLKPSRRRWAGASSTLAGCDIQPLRCAGRSAAVL